MEQIIVANPTHRLKAGACNNSADEELKIQDVQRPASQSNHQENQHTTNVQIRPRSSSLSGTQSNFPVFNSVEACLSDADSEDSDGLAQMRLQQDFELSSESLSYESVIQNWDDGAEVAEMFIDQQDHGEPITVLKPYEYIGNRDVRFYPPRDDLPCHFSFVDKECLIAGMSAPFDQMHWNSMRELDIGLVVNLTEQPVKPANPEWKTMSLKERTFKQICNSCREIDEAYPENVFDGVADSEMQILFLPIRDGSIPRYEQIKFFMKHAVATISKGKRVAVHCQAGIGRTGTFLAIFLMYYYGLTPGQAIKHLRHYRPQSLQFNRYDWQTAPFHHYEEDVYQRNLLQEQYVIKYFIDNIQGKPPVKEWTMSHTHAVRKPARIKRKDSKLDESDDEPIPETKDDTNTEPMFPSYSLNDPDEAYLLLDSELQELVDIEMGKRFADFKHMSDHLNGKPVEFEQKNPASHESELKTDHICYVCQGVVFVGPSPIKDAAKWPKSCDSSTLVFANQLTS